MPNRWYQRPGFVKVRRHAIFPVIVFTLLSLVTGEFYPFSPFSMFSNPDPRPLHYYYLAKNDGSPLPVGWHTGVSPAALTKKFGKHRGDFEESAKDLSDAEIRSKSGIIVLEWLRELSMKRRKRELTFPLHLVEVAIDQDENGKLVENSRAVAVLE